MFLIPMLIKYSLNDIREQLNWSKLVVYRSFWIERERDCWVFGGMNNSSIFPPSAFSALENKMQGSQILLCCFQFLLNSELLKNCWRPKVEMWLIPPSSPEKEWEGGGKNLEALPSRSATCFPWGRNSSSVLYRDLWRWGQGFPLTGNQS